MTDMSFCPGLNYELCIMNYVFFSGGAGGGRLLPPPGQH